MEKEYTSTNARFKQAILGKHGKKNKKTTNVERQLIKMQHVHIVNRRM
jgi:hypothetical protein